MRRSGSPAQSLYISLLAALAAALGGAATSVDLVSFSGAKAQQFAAARGVDMEFLRNPAHQYMHPYYPPLVSNVFALATMAAGRFVWTAAALTFPLALAALAAALPGVLRGMTSARAAAATSALVVATLACVGSQADIAGNADMPLYLFETLAMALLLRPDTADTAGDLLAGTLFAAAATAKVEGLPFALAATAIALWLRGGSPGERAKAALRLLGPTALALAAWFAFGISRKLFSEYSEYGRFFDIHLERGAGIAAEIVKSLAATGRGLAYAIPLLCLVAVGRRGRMAALPLGTAAALAGFLVFTYLHFAGDSAQWIAWSAPRVSHRSPSSSHWRPPAGRKHDPARRRAARPLAASLADRSLRALLLSDRRPHRAPARRAALSAHHAARPHRSKSGRSVGVSGSLPRPPARPPRIHDPGGGSRHRDVPLHHVVRRVSLSIPLPTTYYRMQMPEVGRQADFVLAYRKAPPADWNLRLVARVRHGAVYARVPAP